MANQVFVSPGVYTSELDLTYVTRQVGVTTLGLVGETTKGPAFQPIFVSNYGEFQSFFGGLNNELVNGPDGNGAPKYELPYIAKSYLSQSNQLFVTRILGFSGYYAGLSWGITLSAALDPNAPSGKTYNNSAYTGNYTATTGGTLVSYVTNDTLVNSNYASNPTNYSFLTAATNGTSANVVIPQVKIGTTFSGGNISVNVISTGMTSDYTGYTTGNTYTGGANYLISYTATTGGSATITGLTSNDTLFNLYYSANSSDVNSYLLLNNSGSTALNRTLTKTRVGVTFYGGNFSTKITVTGTSGTYITGVTSGTTVYYSGTNYNYVTGTTSGASYTYSGSGYSDIEGQVIALLRSRATVPVSTQVPAFQITASTGINFNSSVTGASTNELATFNLTGTSTTIGNFDYSLSLDKTQKNYIGKVLGRSASDKKTAIYLEELYDNIFSVNNANGKIYGINQTLVNYDLQFKNYLQQYQPAVTPYVVSELRGNQVLRLFRLWTISDGNTANEQFKISITNIKPDTKEFDVQIRSYADLDASPMILEAFTRCTMDPTSNNYIARRIGSIDGTYASKSAYVLVELDDASDTSDAFPAGFVGFPVRNYQLASNNSSVKTPKILYNQAYGTYDNKRKIYLGLSDTVGIDSDFFDYKGIPTGQSYAQWTGLTHGFHMDVNASGVTIDDVKEYINGFSGATYNPIFLFDTGNAPFQSEAGVQGTAYEKLYARKFTFVPYGGFDGWDIFRTRRTNLDSYQINGTSGQAGGPNRSGVFKNMALSNGDMGITSDYYAYLEGIWTFRNPEAVNINVFATPGIDTFDNQELVNQTIEMVEQDRADSLYIVTTPDVDSAGSALLPSDATDQLDGLFDSNYTATYWPWVQILDSENNTYIYVPPTRDVVRNIALTDNISFPWFAVAGVQRGDVDAIKARVKLTLNERDLLYENRINPIATFVSDGIKIWGNKTLQVADTYLNRINVRRLLLQARKLISAVAIRLLFEQNDTIVRNQFLALVNPILDNIRTERGLTDFRVVLSNNPEDIDRNQLTGQIFLKPTTALEFIQIEFVIMNSGASFDNI